MLCKFIKIVIQDVVFLYTIVYSGCAQFLVMCANCTESSVSREYFTRFESFSDALFDKPDLDYDRGLESFSKSIL